MTHVHLVVNLNYYFYIFLNKTSNNIKLNNSLIIILIQTYISTAMVVSIIFIEIKAKLKI